MIDENNGEPGFYGWVNGGLLFIIYFVTMGIVFYGFGVIFPAMIQATGWGRGDASVAQSLNVILTGLLAPAAAWMINRHGSRKTILFGIVVGAIGLWLLGLGSIKMWHWIVLWGVMMPFSFAFSGMLPIQATINFWFNVKRSTVMGLVMTGAALGGFLAQPFFTWLMEWSGSWQTAWVTAAIFTLVVLVLCFWVRDKPEDLGQYADGLPPEKLDSTDKRNRGNRTYRTRDMWSLKEALRTKVVWFLLVLFLAQMMPVFMMTTHGVLHFLDQGYSGMQSAMVLSSILFGSGLARLPMGWLGDRMEPRRIVFAVMVIRLFSFVGLWLSPNLTLLLICGFSFGFSYGTSIVLIPIITANYFGPMAFASINGIMAPVMIIFGAMVPVGAGYISDRMASYDLVFMTLVGIIGAGILCTYLLKPPTKTRKPQLD
ncbi:MFS transporter [Thermodesulfobacteriota bacterium]